MLMKKTALLLLMITVGCSKPDPYIEWHRLQAEIIKINETETINCKKQGKEWGMDKNGFGPICVTLPPVAAAPAIPAETNK